MFLHVKWDQYFLLKCYRYLPIVAVSSRLSLWVTTGLCAAAELHCKRPLGSSYPKRSPLPSWDINPPGSVSSILPYLEIPCGNKSWELLPDELCKSGSWFCGNGVAVVFFMLRFTTIWLSGVVCLGTRDTCVVLLGLWVVLRTSGWIIAGAAVVLKMIASGTNVCAGVLCRSVDAIVGWIGSFVRSSFCRIFS